MNYIVVIHKDPDSDFGVSFSDFPACITAGKARHHHWHRQVGNDGIVRVTVPWDRCALSLGQKTQKAQKPGIFLA